MEDCVDSIDAEVLLGGGCLAGWLAVRAVRRADRLSNFRSRSASKAI